MPTLSTKGQIVIPADVRRRHGWKPGQELDVVDSGDGVVLRPPAPPTPSREEIRAALDRLRAVAAYTGPRIPVEKMSIFSVPYEDLYPDGP